MRSYRRRMNEGAEFSPDDVYVYNPYYGEEDTQRLNPKKVIIPSTYKYVFDDGKEEDAPLEEIYDRAFFYCTSLQELEIQNGIEWIGANAFNDCISLKEVVLPDSVKGIATGAFSCCRALQKIYIPDGVEEIRDAAFCCCTSLQEITLPSHIKRIGRDTFYSCSSLKEIYIPDGVTEIGNEAFTFCHSLQKVRIPSSVEKIGEYAFGQCESIQEVTIDGEYRPEIFNNTFLPNGATLIWRDEGIREIMENGKSRRLGEGYHTRHKSLKRRMNESMTKEEILDKCRRDGDVEIDYEFTLKTTDGWYPCFQYLYSVGKDRIILLFEDNMDIIYDYLNFHTNISEETLNEWSDDDYLTYVYDNFDSLLKEYLYTFIYSAFDDEAREDCWNYLTYEYVYEEDPDWKVLDIR